MSVDSKTRVLVFVDEANITTSASRHFNKTIDWIKFREYLVNYGGKPRELVEMAIYVGLPPTISTWVERRVAKFNYCHRLRTMGFMVYQKNGQPRNHGHFKANVDVMMAIDAIDMTLRIKPDSVILVTGDADFGHLALTIRRQGIKVEVASTPQAMSNELRASANSFIDLTDLLATFEDYRSPSVQGELDVIVKNPIPAPILANDHDFYPEAEVCGVGEGADAERPPTNADTYLAITN
jgi:uncharacterized LabA/DUF88 family protein